MRGQIHRTPAHPAYPASGKPDPHRHHHTSSSILPSFPLSSACRPSQLLLQLRRRRMRDPLGSALPPQPSQTTTRATSPPSPPLAGFITYWYPIHAVGVVLFASHAHSSRSLTQPSKLLVRNSVTQVIQLTPPSIIQSVSLRYSSSTIAPHPLLCSTTFLSPPHITYASPLPTNRERPPRRRFCFRWCWRCISGLCLRDPCVLNQLLIILAQQGLLLLQSLPTYLPSSSFLKIYDTPARVLFPSSAFRRRCRSGTLTF